MRVNVRRSASSLLLTLVRSHLPNQRLIANDSECFVYLMDNFLRTCGDFATQVRVHGDWSCVHRYSAKQLQGHVSHVTTYTYNAHLCAMQTKKWRRTMPVYGLSAG